MFIINYGVHDYYDTSLAYISEPDKSCIYDRKTYSNKFKHKTLNVRPAQRIFIDGNKHIYIEQHILLFCGETIPLISISFGRGGVENYFYSIKEVIEFCKIHNVHLENGIRYHLFGPIFSLNSLNNYFEKNKLLYPEIFREYKSPCLLVSYTSHYELTITVNPILKNLRFSSLYPATEAFQKIYMFIANSLCNVTEKNEPISDIIKRDQKGFDKNSFKTMKGDKKPRKKNRRKRDLSKN